MPKRYCVGISCIQAPEDREFKFARIRKTHKSLPNREALRIPSPNNLAYRRRSDLIASGSRSSSSRARSAAMPPR